MVPVTCTVIIEEGSQQPWLILRDEGARVLPIACGPVEATAVSMVQQNIKTPRPMTHDLLLDVVRAMGEAREVRITELRGTTFFAELIVTDTNGGERTVSCRPSDGIALAVRAEIPVLVQEALFEAVSEYRDRLVFRANDDHEGDAEVPEL
jgi:bifunctional DNase/RNase